VTSPHAVWLDPDEAPGEVRPRCRTCGWAGTRTETLDDADTEGDLHEADPAGSELWHGTGPYPGAPREAITAQAARLLCYHLTETEPARMTSVSDGVSWRALARRGLAVKVGRGWQRTRRGTAWAQDGRTR
jgi:hypothetical protein